MIKLYAFLALMLVVNVIFSQGGEIDKRGADPPKFEHDFFEKRGVDRNKFKGGIGKREIDQYRFNIRGGSRAAIPVVDSVMKKDHTGHLPGQKNSVYKFLKSFMERIINEIDRFGIKIKRNFSRLLYSSKN
ncbi:hypothetical protein HELRODRAFT_183734 [Helobdella robusta]|uniref:Uncharacterized protein n=1 Tax=Helobdella robusta TaxID=6412 RepID=T1FK44_HELRO|nr:hypothetical protein HELRODRAFT_183734 [Helobdella robusta]ESO10322.1 hypothetical protein HELRODRAFT_183734 [Helobdella robusta]